MEIAHVTLRDTNDAGGIFSATLALSTTLHGDVSETTIIFIVDAFQKSDFKYRPLCPYIAYAYLYRIFFETD
jgi:hypothetical protein